MTAERIRSGDSESARAVLRPWRNLMGKVPEWSEALLGRAGGAALEA
jgi:hypothetical protein